MYIYFQHNLPQRRKLQLSPEQCSDFYAEHYGKLSFPSLTAFMSSGPITALALARENAVAHWKALIGPAQRARATEPEGSVKHWVEVAPMMLRFS